MPNRSNLPPAAAALCAVVCLLFPSLALAAPPPDAVVRMIQAAADDPAELKVVAAVARRANPDSAAEIDALVGRIADRAEAARVARLENQGFAQGWSGEGQVGGFVSTGNSDDVGVAVGLAFKKESLRWRHALDLAVDYQRSHGVASKERYRAAYAGEFKFGDRTFGSLGLSAERDRFAGYRRRFTESLGLGYRLFNRPALTLDVEAGPALRQTDYYLRGAENTAGLHLGSDLSWTIAPDLVFTQGVEAYAESGNSTVTSATALTTKLYGALSARASVDVRHETNPPAGRESTDTTSRVTLVYSF